MRRVSVSWIFLIGALLACGGCATLTGGTSSRDSFVFRARFWDMDTFSHDLAHEVRSVIAGDGRDIPPESDFTAAFGRGAVSRDLGPQIVAAWRVGQARTLLECVSGYASVPGLASIVSFRACPQQTPRETYVEWVVPRAQVRAVPNPQFVVEIYAPQHYEVIYHRGATGEGGYLSTRDNSSGENEVTRILESGSAGANLNFILQRIRS